MQIDDPHEHALVLKAFQSAIGRGGYVTGYVEWNEQGAANSFMNLSSLGLTPHHVRDLLINLVKTG